MRPYLSYPFQNAVRELTGVRTQKNEPLNNCTSLDVPLKDDEPDFTLADTIADETAVNAPEQAELEDDYRILHEAVDNLKEPMNRVINAYYFEDKSFTQIGKEMGISHSTVSPIKAKGLRCLRSPKPLLQLYREEMQHEALNSMQRYQTRPDMHLYIRSLEEKYIQMLNKNTA